MTDTTSEGFRKTAQARNRCAQCRHAPAETEVNRRTSPPCCPGESASKAGSERNRPFKTAGSGPASPGGTPAPEEQGKTEPPAQIPAGVQASVQGDSPARTVEKPRWQSALTGNQPDRPASMGGPTPCVHRNMGLHRVHCLVQGREAFPAVFSGKKQPRLHPGCWNVSWISGHQKTRDSSRSVEILLFQLYPGGKLQLEHISGAQQGCDPGGSLDASPEARSAESFPSVRSGHSQGEPS